MNPDLERAEFREWLKWRQILNANLTMSLGLVLLSCRWSWLSFPAGLAVGSAATITVLLATGILPPKPSPNAQRERPEANV